MLLVERQEGQPQPILPNWSLCGVDYKVPAYPAHSLTINTKIPGGFAAQAFMIDYGLPKQQRQNTERFSVITS